MAVTLNETEITELLDLLDAAVEIPDNPEEGELDQEDNDLMAVEPASKIPKLGSSCSDDADVIIADIISMSSSVEKHSGQAKPSKRKFAQGRPKDPVHDEFIPVENSNKVQCPQCMTKISGRVDVMKNHKRTCKPKARQLCRTQVTTATATGGTDGVTNHKSSGALVPFVTKPASLFENWKEAPVSQKPMRRFLDGLTEKEKWELHLKCAKFVYACNLPFKTVENPEFLDFVASLRPAYLPPSARDVGDRLLGEVYEQVNGKLTAALMNKEVTLQQDGWSTNQNQPVIAHSIHCGNDVHFLNATYTGTNTKNAEYCFKLLMEAIHICENTHGCKVIAVVTDSCKTMESLRALIAKERKDIISYGCNAHHLNNVGKKVTPANKMSDIISVQKCFKNHHFQAAALVAQKANRPVLPGDTRWNSQQDCLQNFLDNHSTYLDILRKNPKQFEAKIANLIKSPSIYDEASSILETAKPIAASLDKCQGNKFTISQAVEEWIGLRSKLKLDKSEKEYFVKKIGEAFSPPALAAHILDPRFRGNGLSTFEIECGYDWLEIQNPELVTLAVELEARNDDKFPKYLMTEDRLKSTDPKSFWAIVENRGVFSASACQFAQRLMKLPASSSGIERCFSTMSSIYSRNRNQLAVDKALYYLQIFAVLKRR